MSMSQIKESGGQYLQRTPQVQLIRMYTTLDIFKDPRK